MMQSSHNQGGGQERPLFPEDDDDDFDNLDDLTFHSAIDDTVVQSVPVPSSRGLSEKGGVNAVTGQVKVQQPPMNDANLEGGQVNKMEAFEIEGPRVDLPPPQLGQPTSSLPSQDGVISGSIDTQQGQPVQVRSSAEEYISGVKNSIGNSWSQSRLGQALKESAHPVPCVFHVLFKVLALFFYIFGGWFAGASNFVTITVICIILLALDFWVVKNITGRLLVGLRWWNKVEDDGSTHWIFESAERNYSNKFDNGVFWGVTYATPLMWSALFMIGVLKFEVGWLIVVVIALTLSISNVYGYWKCSSDQKVKFEQMIAQGAQMGVSSAIRNNVMGRISELAASRGGGNNSNNAPQPMQSGMTYA